MKEHTVRSFDELLGQVNADVLTMGRLTRSQLAAAQDLFANPGSAAAEAIQAADDRVDELDRKLSDEVQRILALRQPAAVDLRSLISCNRIATDLERIADHAKNIAGRVGKIIDQGNPVNFAPLEQLATRVLGQLDEVLVAIEQGDAGAAKRIWHADSEIDALFDETFSTQLEEMCRQPDTASSYAHALFIAKALERIGDHITNIAEDLIYWVTAERLNKRDTGAVS